MAITVLKNNVPWGPFTRQQIEDGLHRGDFTLKYLAHAPGLKEWLPLGEVLHFLDMPANLPPMPVTKEMPPLPTPGLSRPVPPPFPLTGIPSSKPAPPPLPVSAPSMPERPETSLPKASFLRRAMAFGFDCAVLFLPILFLFALNGLILQIQGWWEKTDPESMRQEWALLNRNFHDLLLIMAIGLAWLYAAGLESSRWQATVGKRWMGIQVVDRYGDRLSFLHASGRHVAKYLSALPCFLGFAMALFSSKGLTLHDRLAETRVVRPPS